MRKSPMTERLAGDDFLQRGAARKTQREVSPFCHSNAKPAAKDFSPHAFAAVFIYGEKFFAGLTGREKGGRFGKTAWKRRDLFFQRKG